MISRIVGTRQLNVVRFEIVIERFILDCRANTRLGHEGEFPLVMLTSIQGSGNT